MAARKKQEPGTALTTPAQTGIVDWQAALRGLEQKTAEVVADIATGTAPRITFDKAGVNFNKEAKGRSVKMVIVAAQFYRTFYDRQYTETDPTGPKCYSFDGNAPHPKSHAPQAKLCKDCQWDKFDSHWNERGGKGCSEVARFAALPAEDFKKKPADVLKLEPYIAGVSVLNRKVLSGYVTKVPGFRNTVTQITANAPRGGGNVGYDLELEAVGSLTMNNETGPVIVQMAQAADKKLNEPMPEYKEAEKSAKRKKFSSK